MGSGGSASRVGLDDPARRADSKYLPHDHFPMDGRERATICLSIAGWFTFSLASLFLAKHVLHVCKVNEAVFTLWQFSSSVLFGLIFTKFLRWHPLAVLSREQIRRVMPLSAAFLIKEMLKYASLARVSVNLVNTIRSLGPLFNVSLEALFFRHRPPPRVLWSLVPIVCGVALTSFEELQTASVLGAQIVHTGLGLSAAIASTAINNGQNIYSKILFGKERIDPVSLQIYLSGISLMLMAPGSVSQFFYHAATSDAPKRHYFAPSLHVAGIMVLAGFVNFVSSQLAFNTLNRISPLSYSVANTFKRVCIAVIAIFYLGEHLSVVNGAGITVSIAGVFLYERVSRAYKESRMYRRPDSASPRPVHRHTGSEERLDMLDLPLQPTPKPAGLRGSKMSPSPQKVASVSKSGIPKYPPNVLIQQSPRQANNGESNSNVQLISANQ